MACQACQLFPRPETSVKVTLFLGIQRCVFSGGEPDRHNMFWVNSWKIYEKKQIKTGNLWASWWEHSLVMQLFGFMNAKESKKCLPDAVGQLSGQKIHTVVLHDLINEQILEKHKWTYWNPLKILKSIFSRSIIEIYFTTFRLETF